MLGNFFKKDLAGVYFSSKGFVVVQQSSGKITNQICAPYLSFADGGAALSDDIFEVFKNREIELIAFLQKALRDSKVDTNKIVVSLPAQDLIIRFFEMPNIPQSEISAGINFEMKKYIPFKIEELAFDFQYRVKRKANIIEVVLCGMRQGSLDRYINLFKQLNLEVQAFEPGLFSLFRLLVIKNKILSDHSYVILEFDKGEANIMIADKGFFYFTRDIKLVSLQSAVKTQEEFDAVLFRLINEVRVSLDYYRRQFLRKDVDEMIVISGGEYSGWADNFSKELGLKVSFIPLGDLLKLKDAPGDMLAGASKAFGAALRIENPSLVTLNLGKSKERSEKAALAGAGFLSESPDKMIMNFLRESKSALNKGIAIGIVILLVSYGMGFSKLFPLEKDYSAASVKQPPLLPGIDLTSLESVKISETAFADKERVISGLNDKNSFFHNKISLLTKLLPTGVWLSSFTYTADPMTLDLSCYSYSEDEKVRSENINLFVTRLKQDEDFSKSFSLIDLKFYREVKQGDVLLMQFEVHCQRKGP